MSWQPEVDEITARQNAALKLGGEANIARHHSRHRLTVRERIHALLDDGSFEEIGSLTGNSVYDEEGRRIGSAPSNIVCGFGKADGRTIFVTGDDFTLKGGSSEAGNVYKQRHSELLVRDMKVPLVRLVDGSGGGGSVRDLEDIGRTYVPLGRHRPPVVPVVVENLSRVPVVGLCLGSVAGIGAIRVVISHYSMMVRDSSHLFVAGPPLVNQTGETPRTKEELGGAGIHGKSGAIDDIVDSELEAFERTRRFLSYLPSSVDDLPPRACIDDDPDRVEESLINAVPRERRRPHKVRKIIEAIVDRGSFFELSRTYGKSIVIGLARFDGWPVLLMAGDPFTMGAAWTAAASQKITRFVDMANTFHLPVVHLVDCPGFEIGLRGETANTIRHGARAICAISAFKGPWCSIIIRNATGLGGAAHQPVEAISMRYAWPSARWGSLPIEGGIEAAYKTEIETAPDPEAKRTEIYARLEAIQSPFRTAEVYDIEELIDPRGTRSVICRFANRTSGLRQTSPVSLPLRP